MRDSPPGQGTFPFPGRRSGELDESTLPEGIRPSTPAPPPRQPPRLYGSDAVEQNTLMNANEAAAPSAGLAARMVFHEQPLNERMR